MTPFNIFLLGSLTGIVIMIIAMLILMSQLYKAQDASKALAINQETIRIQ